MTLQEAREIVGNGSSPLSQTSKMPGKSFSIPAAECKTGSKLAKIKNTVCSKCYAMKGSYTWSTTKKAQYRRLDRLTHAKWVPAMAVLLKKQDWFRWHDAGDLQGVWHLDNIVQVCRLTPNTKHWLPTREYSVVSDWVQENGRFPDNLTVRLSTLKIDFPPPTALAKRTGCVTSGVSSDDTFNCPAKHQNNECRDCRSCWDESVSNVNYNLH
tara:strand:- start:2093 stop:2728 length:636 start_codon:yes stop_codon:yes gene_type:complete